MKIQTRSVQETQTFGKKLGQLLQSGDVIALKGDLGAGKTSLVRGLALGLGVPENYAVTSPTFVLMQTYPGKTNLHHLDFYRIETYDEIASLGLTEWMGEDGVVVIEWYEKFPSVWTGDTIHIGLTVDSENMRTLELRENTPRSVALARALEGLA